MKIPNLKKKKPHGGDYEEYTKKKKKNFKV